jgi:hypothetical protein
LELCRDILRLLFKDGTQVGEKNCYFIDLIDDVIGEFFANLLKEGIILY